MVWLNVVQIAMTFWIIEVFTLVSNLHKQRKMLSLQIQDYRNCLFHKEGFGSTQKSPIVHRVILQMCMENVVKDMVSMSDESWTYKDLLVSEHQQLFDGSLVSASRIEP